VMSGPIDPIQLIPLLRIASPKKKLISPKPLALIGSGRARERSGGRQVRTPEHFG
jgi:hypothetical protein